MHVRINGKEHEVPGDMATLKAIMEYMGFDQETTGIAVAVNLSMVRKEDWGNVKVEGGDEIEIITARQGG